MREIFRGYYRPTKAEFKKLWAEALIIPDASLLLNIYRYSNTARKQLLDTLRAAGDRLWVPYQAAWEFQRNRLSVIQKQKDMHADLQKELAKVRSQLESKAGELRRHPVLEPDIVLKHVNDFTSQLDKYLSKHPDPYPFKTDLFTDDPIRQQLTNVIDDKVGSPLPDEEIKRICEGGKERYKRRIPPGFLDADKDDERQFGDLVLWHEILHKARDANRPVIFVTDDEKEDWWWHFKGQTLGPRPELVQELFEFASVAMYMYNSLRFIEEAQEFFGLKVSEETLKEIGTVRELSMRLDPVEPEPRPTRLSKRLFTETEAAEICDMTLSAITHWVGVEAIHPATTDQGNLYRFSELIALRALHELVMNGRLGVAVIDAKAPDITKRIGLASRIGHLVVTPSGIFAVADEDLTSFLQDLEERYSVVDMISVRRMITTKARTRTLVE